MTRINGVLGWLSNILSMNEKTLEIRMPQRKGIDALHNLKPNLFIVLSEVVLHKRTSILKLTRILGLPVLEIEELVTALLRMGLLYEYTPGIFAVNIYIEPMVVQVLEERDVI